MMNPFSQTKITSIRSGHQAMAEKISGREFAQDDLYMESLLAYVDQVVSSSMADDGDDRSDGQDLFLSAESE